MHRPIQFRKASAPRIRTNTITTRIPTYRPPRRRISDDMAFHPSETAGSKESQTRLIALVMALFFAFGFCTVLVDSVIPKLKATFALSYAEVMLTQFCFFGAYFLISVPAAWLHKRIGYLRGVAVGLSVMALGCLLFTPAADAGIYPGFL